MAIDTLRQAQEQEFMDSVKKAFDDYNIVKRNKDNISYYTIPIEGFEAIARKFYQMGKDHNEQEWRASLFGLKKLKLQ